MQDRFMGQIARNFNIPAKRLAFVRADLTPFSGPEDFWLPARSGNYSTDRNLGALMARDAIGRMGDVDLEWIVERAIHGMVSRGEFGGLETGFVRQIANYAMVGAVYAGGLA